jgi:hypothetical protein
MMCDFSHRTQLKISQIQKQNTQVDFVYYDFNIMYSVLIITQVIFIHRGEIGTKNKRKNSL